MRPKSTSSRSRLPPVRRTRLDERGADRTCFRVTAQLLGVELEAERVPFFERCAGRAKPKWPAAPGVFCALALAVLFDSPGHVPRDSRIKRTVCALQEVDVPTEHRNAVIL